MMGISQHETLGMTDICARPEPHPRTSAPDNGSSQDQDVQSPALLIRGCPPSASTVSQGYSFMHSGHFALEKAVPFTRLQGLPGESLHATRSFEPSLTVETPTFFTPRLQPPLRRAHYRSNLGHSDPSYRTPASPRVNSAEQQQPPSSSPSNVSGLSPGPVNPLATDLGRDTLLNYAYHLYHSSSNSMPTGLSPTPVFSAIPDVTAPEQIYASQLMPLLNISRAIHPHHPPTLLLLGSVHFALGDFPSSLALNYEILSIDPNYVEAMCNVGAVMRALSREDDAQRWWWKALKLQPMYWDVMDNLLNMVLAPCASVAGDLRSGSHEEHAPLYEEALEICRFVQSQIIDSDGRLLVTIPPHQFHRFQNLFCTGANLLYLLKRFSLHEYFRAIEFSISGPFPSLDAERYTFRDCILATCIAGIMMTSPEGSIPTGVAEGLGLPRPSELSHLIGQPQFSLLRIVHDAGDRLVDAVLREGYGLLPTLLLEPAQTSRLSISLFPKSLGVLPSICLRVGDNASMELPPDAVRQQTHMMMANILLSLAKRYQEGHSHAGICPGTGIPIPLSTSLVMLLDYMALSLSPSPSAYNNIGALFSSLSTMVTRTVDGKQQTITGQQFARAYYEKGLQMDPTNPYLLTNLGSLLKDQGQLTQAMQLYLSALKFQPGLDVALANVANTIKDMGRPWDAVPFYRRAVAANPDLAEATCGLVHSLNAICDWRGHGDTVSEIAVNDNAFIREPRLGEATLVGWNSEVTDICERQLQLAYSDNVGVVSAANSLEGWLEMVQSAAKHSFRSGEMELWRERLAPFYTDFDRTQENVNEGGCVIRLIEWLLRSMKRTWYLEIYGAVSRTDHLVSPPSRDTYSSFPRPIVPPCITISAPCVLPFHAFTYPLSSRTIRRIAHRTALRISQTSLTEHWLPNHIYPPPPPAFRKLNIGYVSGDLNNHPLAHLMQSVFGLHDSNRFNVHVYATSRSDGSMFRRKIEADTPQFLDVSAWSTSSVIERIVEDRIHILVNLGGYTKGTRNEIFAARPCPIQVSLMGFAGTLAAGWCDYLICDEITCPQDLCARERSKFLRHHSLVEQERSHVGVSIGADLDPESADFEWMYTEKFIYMPHTFMVTDHKQSFRADENLSVAEREQIPAAKIWQDEKKRRREMRKALFPDLTSDTVVFANFNQLYKIDPAIFATWLHILARVPCSILWLLRFPAAGEEHLIRTAKAWAGDEIASRVRFTDVVKKDEHVYRCRVADLFLDTVECSAHTIAADVLWTGTPVLTWPKYRYKLASRVGASMAYATGFGSEMVVSSLEEYEDRAVFMANSLRYDATEESSGGIDEDSGALISLRRAIYLNRDHMPLFDTARWTHNLEKGYDEAWERWVFSDDESIDEEEGSLEKSNGCIRVQDNDAVSVRPCDS